MRIAAGARASREPRLVGARRRRWWGWRRRWRRKRRLQPTTDGQRRSRRCAPWSTISAIGAEGAQAECCTVPAVIARAVAYERAAEGAARVNAHIKAPAVVVVDVGPEVCGGRPRAAPDGARAGAAVRCLGPVVVGGGAGAALHDLSARAVVIRCFWIVPEATTVRAATRATGARRVRVGAVVECAAIHAANERVSARAVVDGRDRCKVGGARIGAAEVAAAPVVPVGD